MIQGSVLSPILFNLFINDLLDEFEAIGIFTRAYADDIAWVCSSLEQARNTKDTMKRWWDRNGMKINETKSGILRILKRRGKIDVIKNWLDIIEVSEYKYLGIMINQSITISNQNQYLKNKITQMKRKAGVIQTALIDTKSKVEFLSTIIMPKLSYACKALFDNKEEIGNHLRSVIYQCTKTMFGIRGNVKINNILEVLKINPTIDHKILKRWIITDYLSQKAIKLRIGWLFSWKNKRLCNCSHIQIL